MTRFVRMFNAIAADIVKAAMVDNLNTEFAAGLRQQAESLFQGLVRHPAGEQHDSEQAGLEGEECHQQPGDTLALVSCARSK